MPPPEPVSVRGSTFRMQDGGAGRVSGGGYRKCVSW